MGEHGVVVVALDHEVVGLGHVVGGAIGDNPHVGAHDEALVAGLDAEAHVVEGVVAGLEGGDGHAGELEGDFLEHLLVVVADAPRHVVVHEHATQ